MQWEETLLRSIELHLPVFNNPRSIWARFWCFVHCTQGFEGLARIAAHLQGQAADTGQYVQNGETDWAFAFLQKCLSKLPLFSFPDIEKLFVATFVNASWVAVGTSLMQKTQRCATSIALCQWDIDHSQTEAWFGWAKGSTCQFFLEKLPSLLLSISIWRLELSRGAGSVLSRAEVCGRLTWSSSIWRNIKLRSDTYQVQRMRCQASWRNIVG